MNAIGEVSTRAKALRVSVDRAVSAWSDGSPGDLNAYFGRVTADANHLRKALLLSGLPPEFESARFEMDLDERIRHARNLLEHWENPGPSLEWFEKRYPDSKLGLLEKTGEGDIRVSGIYRVSEIRKVLQDVDRAFWALARAQQ